MSPALWLLAPVSRSVYRRVGRVAGRAGRYYARFTAYCRGCGASTPPGLPPFCLNVKTNAVFRILQNFSIDRHLVKNVKVVVTSVGNHIITVKVLRDRPSLSDLIEEDVILPRISFLHTLHSGHTLLRRQFPLAPAYSTTFHSCEGLTYDKIGIDLTRPVFTHGQLYTALSRVRCRTDAKVRLQAGESTTTNITYHQLLLPSL